MKKYIFIFVMTILSSGRLIGQDNPPGFKIGSYCGSQQVTTPFQALFIVSEEDKVLEYVEDNSKKSDSFLKVLSPDWIESLSVKKGDKAISEYGEMGKSGVVLISLKKGSMIKMPEAWQERFIEKKL